ncbi:MAG TPA: hypothetical protein VII48_14030, partial [Rhizomicrobium sp.]
MTRFGTLEALRARPIADQSAAREARRDFRTRVPIRRDNELFGEAVVEARDFGLKGANYYASAFNPPYWQPIAGATDKLFLRHTVAEKLRKVNARANQAGLEL